MNAIAITEIKELYFSHASDVVENLTIKYSK